MNSSHYDAKAADKERCKLCDGKGYTLRTTIETRFISMLIPALALPKVVQDQCVRCRGSGYIKPNR